MANPLVDRIGDFQVPPTCQWSKSLGSVPSSWYSAIDNYIASNDGSTSSTSKQRRAVPKAKTEGWAMFRKDHGRMAEENFRFPSGLVR